MFHVLGIRAEVIAFRWTELARVGTSIETHCGILYIHVLIRKRRLNAEGNYTRDAASLIDLKNIHMIEDFGYVVLAFLDYTFSTELDTNCGRGL